MKRALLALWRGGAVIYAAGTLTRSLDTNKTISGSRPGEYVTRSEPVQNGLSGNEEADRVNRHVSPGAAVSTSSDPSTVHEAPKPAANDAELLKVVSAARIRSLPSNSADVIGTALAGAQIRVAKRESGWVHFIDPESGQSGWIDSVFLEPVSTPTDATAQAPPVDKKLNPPSTVAQKTSKKKPTAKQQPVRRTLSKRPPTVAKQSAKSEPHVVRFPSDEEFIPPRKRRFGLFARRRMMMRQALPPSLQEEWPPTR
jgi:hypothetical protein